MPGWVQAFRTVVFIIESRMSSEGIRSLVNSYLERQEAMSRESFQVEDGIEELRDEIPIIVDLIARTSKWVNPAAFRALPVWYPESYRGAPSYDATWRRRYTNTSRTSGQITEKTEPNILAGKAFIAALGLRRKVENWTVCHIWGRDDPKFQAPNSVVRDPRFYSCVANMVWIPTPLKGFTDSVPEIKLMLRTCAYYLYGWACEHEHEEVRIQAEAVRNGIIPPGYPESWPSPDRNIQPPGTAPFTRAIQEAIEKRKAELQRCLGDARLEFFPRDQVKNVIEFWQISFND
jgi:hypothetical protein